MITYPIIYSLIEQEERNIFATFFQTLFKLCDDKYATFPEGLDSTTLYRMYTAYRPNTIMTESMLAQQISMGGYVNKRNKLMCSIIPSGFTTLPLETQIFILDAAPYDKTLNLRQQILGMNQSVIDKGNVFDMGLRRYLLTQCFTTQFKFWGNIPAVERRTVLNELFIYYVSYCSSLQILSLNRGAFYKALQELGYIIKKGYCNGVSGVTYLDKLVIPNRDFRDDSIKYGFGIINVQGKLIFNDGMILKDLNEEQLKTYLEARKVGIHGQPQDAKRTTKETEKAGNSNISTSNEESITITSIREEELYSSRQEEETDGDNAGDNEDNVELLPSDERTIDSAGSTTTNASIGITTGSVYISGRDGVIEESFVRSISNIPSEDITGECRAREFCTTGEEHTDMGTGNTGNKEFIVTGGFIPPTGYGNEARTIQTSENARSLLPEFSGDSNGSTGEGTGERTGINTSIPSATNVSSIVKKDGEGHREIIPDKFKRELFSGLRVTYRINPGTFDLDRFVEECEMSGCPLLPLADLEILYEEFIGTIKK